MNVVLWGINYHPEATGIGPFTTELAKYLNANGHDAKVVTAFRYYPEWRKAPGDSGAIFRTDTLDGVKVHRCWHYVPRRVTTSRRIVHELSFVVMSFLRILTLPRADVYVVVSPPLALGAAAWIATRLKGSRYVFHVQDLQPDAAVALGMVNRGPVVRGLYLLERLAYRHAAAVSGISEGMLTAFARKGVRPARCILFPNWLRNSEASRHRPGGFRVRNGIPASALLAVYSGNLGRKQGIEVLLGAAKHLVDPAMDSPGAARIIILIAGAGAGRDALAELIAGSGLPNVVLLPLLDDEEYAAMLGEADIALVTQAAGTGRFFFPSKLLSVLRAALPVVTVADRDSELAAAVAEGGFGINVEPGRPSSLADALRHMGADPALRRELAARTRWVERFQPAHVLPRFVSQLEDLASTEKERAFQPHSAV
jgi:colanic acid biosynthesis glycosyl transferase WcaI